MVYRPTEHVQHLGSLRQAGVEENVLKSPRYAQFVLVQNGHDLVELVRIVLVILLQVAVQPQRLQAHHGGQQLSGAVHLDALRIATQLVHPLACGLLHTVTPFASAFDLPFASPIGSPIGSQFATPLAHRLARRSQFAIKLIRTGRRFTFSLAVALDVYFERATDHTGRR